MIQKSPRKGIFRIDSRTNTHGSSAHTRHKVDAAQVSIQG